MVNALDMPENIKDTLVINLFGGPGSGKSTFAAGVYYKLKRMNIRVKLVQEYAEELCWSNDERINDQLHVTMTQYSRLMGPIGEAEVIVTDTSLLNGIVYGGYGCTNLFEPYVVELFNRFNNTNIFLERNPEFEFDTAGRRQNYEEALAVDGQIKDMLNRNNIRYHCITKNNEEAIDDLVGTIVERIGIIRMLDYLNEQSPPL